MHRSFVRTHHQITIPEELRKHIPIEVGDPVEIYASERGEIVIKPLKAIDPSQSWFWSKEWQEGEREAEEDIRKGRVSPVFKTAKEAAKYLKNGKL